MTFELQLRRSFQKATVDGAMLTASSSSSALLGLKTPDHLHPASARKVPYSAGSSRSTAASPTATMTSGSSDRSSEESDEDTTGGNVHEEEQEERRKTQTEGVVESRKEREGGGGGGGEEKAECQQEARPAAGLPTPTNAKSRVTSAYSTPRCSSSPPAARSTTSATREEEGQRGPSERTSRQQQPYAPRCPANSLRSPRRTSPNEPSRSGPFSPSSSSSSSLEIGVALPRGQKNSREQRETVEVEKGRPSRSRSLVGLRPSRNGRSLRSHHGRRAVEAKKKTRQTRRGDKEKSSHSSSVMARNVFSPRASPSALRVGWSSADAQRAFQIRVVGRGFLIQDFCQLERRTLRRPRSRIRELGDARGEEDEEDRSLFTSSSTGLSRTSRPECILRGQAR